MKIQNAKDNGESARQLIALTCTIAALFLSLGLGSLAANDVACYGELQPPGSPLVPAREAWVVCNPDCSIKNGYCYDYKYNPNGVVPQECSDVSRETGVKCVYDNTDVTRSGQEADGQCYYKNGSANECEYAGACVNWRNTTNKIISVRQDSTSYEGCRTPPGA